MPLLVLHHHRRHPHFSTRRTGLLEGETAGLKCEAQHLLFALRIEIAVPQALRQFGENKEIIPGLALGCNEPLPDFEKRAEAHIGRDLIIGGGGEDDVGVSRVGGVIAVDADQEVQRL